MIVAAIKPALSSPSSPLNQIPRLKTRQINADTDAVAT